MVLAWGYISYFIYLLLFLLVTMLFCARYFIGCLRGMCLDNGMFLFHFPKLKLGSRPTYVERTTCYQEEVGP